MRLFYEIPASAGMTEEESLLYGIPAFAGMAKKRILTLVTSIHRLRRHSVTDNPPDFEWLAELYREEGEMESSESSCLVFFRFRLPNSLLRPLPPNLSLLNEKEE